jgi:hypothetical protein
MHTHQDEPIPNMAFVGRLDPVNDKMVHWMCQVEVSFVGTAYNTLGAQNLPINTLQFWHIASMMDNGLPFFFDAAAPMPAPAQSPI